MRRLPWRWIAIVAGIVLVVGFVRAWDLSSQPSGGDGWRLLARQRGVGEPGLVASIVDQPGLADAWAEFRVPGEPSVDFAASAVYWLTSSGTIGCPTRLDGLVFDIPGRAIVSRFSLGLTAGCDAERVPDSFLVAVDRSRLPPEPFEVRLIGP